MSNKVSRRGQTECDEGRRDDEWNTGGPHEKGKLVVVRSSTNHTAIAVQAEVSALAWVFFAGLGLLAGALSRRGFDLSSAAWL